MEGRKVKWGKGVYGMMRYMERVGPGRYELDWHGGKVVIGRYCDPIHVTHKFKWWNVWVDQVKRYEGRTLNDAMNWVANVWGNEPVETVNILNRKAGKLMIARKDKGGCCDPGTERYHCM